MSRARDGSESWFVEEGAANRMILALRSPLIEENDWALERLLRASSIHNERFNLDKWTNSVEALLGWPEKLLLFAKTSCTSLDWEASTKEEDALRRRAVESLLVLRNAGINDGMNGKLLCGSNRLKILLQTFLSDISPEILSNHLTEHLLLVLDILHNSASSPSFNLSSSSAKLTIPTNLAPFLKSKDRAVLVATFRLILSLASPTPQNNPPILHPTHPLIAKAITSALPCLLLTSNQDDTTLRSIALEMLYEFSTESIEAAVILRRKDIGGIFRILAKGLYEGSEETVHEFELVAGESKGLGMEGIQEEEGEVGPPEGNVPTRAELELIAQQVEPSRSMYWMQRHFVPSPSSQVTQVQFWTSYKEAFSSFAAASSSLAPVAPLLSAQELIKNIGVAFPGATAMCTEDTPPAFVIKGIRVRGSQGPLPQPTPSLPPPTNSSNPPPSTSTFTRLQTPLEPITSTPLGPSFTSSLILRNLARALVDLLHVPESSSGAGGGNSRDEGKEDKVRKGEMFGLPIPEGMRIVGQGMNGSGWASVVGGGQEGGNNQEEEEMEMEMEEGKKGEAEGQLLTEEEGERARAGLVGIEESVLDWAARGEALGNWLAEVLEAISVLG